MSIDKMETQIYMACVTDCRRSLKTAKIYRLNGAASDTKVIESEKVIQSSLNAKSFFLIARRGEVDINIYLLNVYSILWES